MNVKELRKILLEYGDDDAVCFEARECLLEITNVSPCYRNKYTRVSNMSCENFNTVCLIQSVSFFR